jgi:hypothetical protein
MAARAAGDDDAPPRHALSLQWIQPVRSRLLSGDSMDRLAVTLYGFFLVSLSLGLIAFIIAAGSHAAQKTTWSGVASIFSTLVAASGLLIWIGLTIVLATQREIGPHLPFLLFGPPIALALALAFSSDMRELIDAIPIDWAVGRAVQPSRIIVGALFIGAWYQGLLPAVFALVAGSGEILAGLLALRVRQMILKRRRLPRKTILAWNCFGASDFIIAAGAASLAGYFGTAATALEQFPFALVPGFLVPIALMTHVVVFRHLILTRDVGAVRYVD